MLLSLTMNMKQIQKSAVTKQEGLTSTSVRDGACPIGSGLTWMALEVIAHSSLPKAGSRTVSPNANEDRSVKLLVADIARREGLPAHIVQRDLVGPAPYADAQKGVLHTRYTRYRTAAELMTCKL